MRQVTNTYFSCSRFTIIRITYTQHFQKYLIFFKCFNNLLSNSRDTPCINPGTEVRIQSAVHYIELY